MHNFTHYSRFDIWKLDFSSCDENPILFIIGKGDFSLDLFTLGTSFQFLSLSIC